MVSDFNVSDVEELLAFVTMFSVDISGSEGVDSVDMSGGCVVVCVVKEVVVISFELLFAVKSSFCVDVLDVMLLSMLLVSIDIFVSEVVVSADIFGRSDSVCKVVISVTVVCVVVSDVTDVFVFTILSDFEVCVVDIICVSIVVVGIEISDCAVVVSVDRFRKTVFT